MMHRIDSARLVPGAPRPSAPAPATEVAGTADSAAVRGRALIFWDLKVPGKRRKLDAIDTDQITPAADCVSESLETLDERWKAGAFRYLMPDFRARVHRGETFLIAGDRFAIGSSREMSPAGLKAVAEEAGLQMVIVCGRDMGDIFRRNALNLGLHVVQSPEAVADARDGDEFSFDPRSRRITNVTQGRTYEPLPLTAKEEEIRRSGGIVSVGRREFAASVQEVPRIEWPSEHEARRMTVTEQIIWAHRVDRRDIVRPGTTLRVYADLLPASDGTAPFAIHTFNQITGGNVIHPRQAAIANDHFVFTGREDDEKQTSIGRAFAKLHGIEKPVLRDARGRDLPFLFPGAGTGDAGPVHTRRRFTQPRVRRLWRSRDRHRIDHARFWLGDRLRLHDACPRPACRLSREAATVGERQGHRPGAASRVGCQAGAGHVGRTRRCGPTVADRLSQHDRQHDGGSRGDERHLRRRRRSPTRGIAPRASSICRTRARLPATMPSTRSTRQSTSRMSPR